MQFPPLRIFTLAIAVALGLQPARPQRRSSISGLAQITFASLQEDHGDRGQQATEHSPHV